MVSNTSLLSSMTPVLPLATYSISTSHKKNETAKQAIDIGNLNDEAAVVDVSDAGQTMAGTVQTTFQANDGSASLSEVYNNIVDQASTIFQLLDSDSNVIASNDPNASDDQQAAFTEWQQGSLPLTAGTYTATATAGNGAPLAISAQEQQGSSLQVTSQLTGSDATEYYNFSLSGANIKLDFNSKDAKSARVILYNSKGVAVADSGGSTLQKNNFAKLTSASGLSAVSGNYTVEVTYAKGVDQTKNVDYSMNLYSGNSYAIVYKNNVKAQAYDNSAAGSVTADSKTQLFTAQAYHKIKETARTAINIGWMVQDKSMLDVYSQLTSGDNTDYYTFAFEKGDNLKFGFNSKTTKNASALRVQLLDSSGLYVIADSEGTSAQQAAYKQLTTQNGLSAKRGSYVVKVTYAQGAKKSDLPYEFGIYSGSTYSAEYKTTASYESMARAVIMGELKSTTASSGIAAYLTAQKNGEQYGMNGQVTQSGSWDALTNALKNLI